MNKILAVLFIAFSGICSSQVKVIKLSDEDAMAAKAFAVDQKTLEKQYNDARYDAVNVAMEEYAASHRLSLYPQWQAAWNWDISEDNYYAVLLPTAEVIELGAVNRDRLMQTSKALLARKSGYPEFVERIAEKYCTYTGFRDTPILKTMRQPGWEHFRFSLDGKYIVSGGGENY
jgi:hypothetical protein